MSSGKHFSWKLFAVIHMAIAQQLVTVTELNSILSSSSKTNEWMNETIKKLQATNIDSIRHSIETMETSMHSFLHETSLRILIVNCMKKIMQDKHKKFSIDTIQNWTGIGIEDHSNDSICWIANVYKTEPQHNHQPSIHFVQSIKIFNPDSTKEQDNWIYTWLYYVFRNTGLNVFCKLTYATMEDSNYYRAIESLIYEQIIGPLITDRLSPHFMLPIARIKIPSNTMDKWFTKNHHKDWLENLPRPWPEFMNLLVTECAQGITLNNYIKKHLVENECWGLFFQIFYNLAVMDNIRLTHYDLHDRNIFLQETNYKIDKNDKNDPINHIWIYFIDNNRYVRLVIKRYFVRFFDWDLGYAESLHISHNDPLKQSRQNICKNHGRCAIHQSVFDLNQVMLPLIEDYHDKLPSSLIEFMEKQYKNRSIDDINQNIRSRSKICNYFDPNATCRSDHVCKLVRKGSSYVCEGKLNNTNVLSSIQELFVDFIHLMQKLYPQDIKIENINRLPSPYKDMNGSEFKNRVFFINKQVKQHVINVLNKS